MRLSSPKITSPNFFGFAEHGNFESKDTITYLDVPEDQGPCYYFFKDFTIHEGHLVTTTKPCRGLYIYCTGHANIFGTLSMTTRGIYSPPTGEYENGYIPFGMKTLYTVNDGIIDLSLPGIKELAGSMENPIRSGCAGGGKPPTDVMTPENVTDRSGSGGIAGVFCGGAGGGVGFNTNTTGIFDRYKTNGNSASDYGGPAAKPTYGYAGVTIYYINGTGGGCAGLPGYRYNKYITGRSDVWPKDLQIIEDPLLSTSSGVLFLTASNLICGSNSKIESEGTQGTQTYFQGTHYTTGLHDNYGGATGGGSVNILYRQLTGIVKCSAAGKYMGKNYSNNNQIYSPTGAENIYQIL